jgi:hypothetical protein
MEVSGINHNVFGGFLSLKVGIYSVGKGAIQLRDFQYSALGRAVKNRNSTKPAKNSKSS